MKKKNWRVIVIVTYYTGDPANYREPLAGILYDLAWLYKLDFSERHDLRLSPADGSPDQVSPGISDLFYYRSTDKTRVDAKHIRNLIDSVFYGLSPVFEGVEVYTLLQKHLPDFPFPDDFQRPLIYPYVEVHKGRHKQLCIFADLVMKVIEGEQDYPLN